MNNFKELKVWQKSMTLVKEIYSVTKDFPKEERFGITSQIQRSAVSIPSNIAEGCGRNSSKELFQFLSIAQGSSYELETQLILAADLNYMPNASFETINNQIQEVQKMLFSFKRTIKAKTNV